MEGGSWGSSLIGFTQPLNDLVLCSGGFGSGSEVSETETVRVCLPRFCGWEPAVISAAKKEPFLPQMVLCHAAEHCAVLPGACQGLALLIVYAQRQGVHSAPAPRTGAQAGLTQPGSPARGAVFSNVKNLLLPTARALLCSLCRHFTFHRCNTSQSVALRT